MTHIITSLCVRESSCVDVCPVECIVIGKPREDWPWAYIDPNTCIDCGACVPECPFNAIFPEDEVPQEYRLKAGEQRVLHTDAKSITYGGGELVDLTEEIKHNYEFFSNGPGYSAKG